MRSIRIFNGMIDPILNCFVQRGQSMCPILLVFLGNTQYTVPISRPTWMYCLTTSDARIWVEPYHHHRTTTKILKNFFNSPFLTWWIVRFVLVFVYFNNHDLMPKISVFIRTTLTWYDTNAPITPATNKNGAALPIQIVAASSRSTRKKSKPGPRAYRRATIIFIIPTPFYCPCTPTCITNILSFL